MPVDRRARTDLRDALAGYMGGEIQSFAFDARNSACSETPDTSVQQISRFLYGIHDDTVDHPIAISLQNWGVLRRIVAFLDTQLEIDATPAQPAWPFRDHSEWHANEHRVNGIGLPEYDPLIHDRPVHPWWNRIPTLTGSIVLAGLVAAVVLAILLS